MTPNTLLDLLKSEANINPEKLAYCFLSRGGQKDSLTYEMLWEKTKRLAGHLEEAVGHSQIAILLLPSNNVFLITLLACFHRGIIAVPAYPPKAKDLNNRLMSIINDCSPNIILSTSDILYNIKKNFSSDNQLNLINHFAVDTAITTPKAAPPVKSLASDIAFLQYTSGSILLPKGVMVSHGNLISNLKMISDSFQLKPSDIHVSWLPLFHDMGLICGLLLGIYARNPVVFMGSSDFVRSPICWLKTISEWKGTVSAAPNFAYDMSCHRINDKDIDSLDLSSWRIAINGSEPVRQETIQRFTNKFTSCGFSKEAFYVGYGMAEATLFISGKTCNTNNEVMYLDRAAFRDHQIIPVSHKSKAAVAVVQCGHGNWGDQIMLIVDLESNQALPPYAIGEIWVQGSHVTHGYYNNEKATNCTYAAMTTDGKGPFLKTGDLGFLDQKENLYITGRLKDLIIINGQNFYPQDIEQVAENSHEDIVINASAAFGNNDQSKIILVAEIARQKRNLTKFQTIAKNVIDNIAKKIGVSLSECVLIQYRSLPKTSSGKIQRKKTQSMFEKRTLNVVYHHIISKGVSPIQDNLVDEESLEKKLMNYCSYWIGAIIKCDPNEVDLEAPLLSFGLDSLNIVDFSYGIQKIVKSDIDNVLFYEAQSINHLISLIISSKLPPDRHQLNGIREENNNAASDNKKVFIPKF